MQFIDEYHLLAWLTIGILPAFVILANFIESRVAKEHRNLVSYYSRYISTRQATNDILEVIIFNLNCVRNMLVKTRNLINQLPTESTQQQKIFDDIINGFDSYVSQLPADNKLSVDRSYTAEVLHKMNFKNPVKSALFLVPSLFSIALALYLTGADNLPFNKFIIYGVVGLGCISLYMSIGRINRRSRLNQSTEKKLITILDLFDIRRIFIQDTITRLNELLAQLNSHQGYYLRAKKSNDYSKAIDMLSLNIKKLKDIYTITELNVNTPLISVSPILIKAVNNIYAPLAQSKNVQLVNNIQTGLSFHMTQVNIGKLIDPLVISAINNSSSGQTVKINGRPRSRRVEIEIIENLNQLSESDIINLLKFNPNDIEYLPEAGYQDLTLHLAKLIVSTEAGEIKLTTTKDGELSIKLQIPKNRSHEIIKVNPKISKSNSPIN